MDFMQLSTFIRVLYTNKYLADMRILLKMFYFCLDKINLLLKFKAIIVQNKYSWTSVIWP